MSELRDDPTWSVEYVRAAMKDGEEPKALLIALRQVAKAQGVAKIAERAGVERESVYRALSTGGNPRFSTIMSIMKALGLTLSVERLEQQKKRGRSSRVAKR